jgi:LPXTG-site transpeptidase (sortase) family protein
MLLASGFSLSHLSLSSPLGGGSNSVLYGHDDIEGSVFGSLGKLHRGDTVEVAPASGQGQIYKVDSEPRVVSAKATEILQPTQGPRLTLFTCYPLWIDDRRLVVTAVPA